MPVADQHLASYAVMIGVPAIVIVSLALHASYSDYRTINRLERLRVQLAAERLADEVEAAVLNRAEACLRAVDAAVPNPDACTAAESVYRIQRYAITPPPGGITRKRLMSDIAPLTRLAPGRVYALAYNAGPVAQFFYMARPDHATELLVMSYDLNHIAHSPDGFPGLVKGSGINATLVSDRDEKTPLTVFFRTLFPFWRIRILHTDRPVAGPLGLGVSLVMAAAALLAVATRSIARQASDREAFLNAATHGLKLPLANMRLYAEALKHKDQTPEGTHAADTIIFEAERLARRTDRVLAATKARGRNQYDRHPTDLVRVVRNTIHAAQDWVTHAGGVIKAQLPDYELYAVVDDDAVSDSVTDLIENAVKYSGVDAKVVTVRVYRSDRNAVIQVSDSGIGVPKREQARIFRRFTRGRNATEQGGFGLGLFLVDRVMRGHGGRVRLLSSEGTGATFELSFPRCEPS